MLRNKLRIATMLAVSALSMGLANRGVMRPRGHTNGVTDKPPSKRARKRYEEQVAAVMATVEREAYNSTVETRQVRRNRERKAAKGQIST